MSDTLVCRDVGVAYGDVPAIQSLDLSVAPSETVAILGPSGSGKSTLLHAVAGFLDLQTGSINLNGTTVSRPGHTTPPERRPIGLVFQSYALWPHLDALDNVAYPIRRAGTAKSAAREEAARLLDIVGMEGLHHRMTDQLSGGQQQRVGLARALARHADLYLFDEPTAHLDSYIRTSVQNEIDRRRSDTGAAALYATHDASEALAIADRVVVLRDGKTAQLGTPQVVYERPVDVWTGSLTGSLDTVIGTAGEPGTVKVAGVAVPTQFGGDWPSGEVEALVRADWVHPGEGVEGEVAGVRFRGTHTDYEIETAAGKITSRVRGTPEFAPGQRSHWTITRLWIP